MLRASLHRLVLAPQKLDDITGRGAKFSALDAALRIVHLLAAVVWVGGTVSLVFVAVPPVQRLQGEERARVLREFGRRWRPIGWSALGVAIATGLALAARAHAFDSAPRDFDWVLAAKGVLGGLVVAGSYLHDF